MFDYSLNLPPNFGPVNTLQFFIDPNTNDTVFIVVDPVFSFGFGFNPSNPIISNAALTLGRVLFYDPQLSLNNAVACASCHKQELAFSDGVASSPGFCWRRATRWPLLSSTATCSGTPVKAA